jgi:hypothetical protein
MKGKVSYLVPEYAVFGRYRSRFYALASERLGRRQQPLVLDVINS